MTAITKKLLLIGGTAAAVLGALLASVITGGAWPVVSLGVFGLFAGATAMVARRHAQTTGVQFGAWAGAAVGGGIVGVVDGIAWLVTVLAATGLGWFVLRTATKYLAPATALPDAVRTRLERLVTFADESVSGLHVAVRDDGAVFLIGYAGAVRSLDSAEGSISAFRRAAATGVDILATQHMHNVTPLLIVDGTDIRETYPDCTVASLDVAGSVVQRVAAPAFDDVVAAANAAGVQLNRATARQVRSGRGQPGGKRGAKVQHSGRVTRRVD